MIIEKTQNGGLQISTIKDNQLINKVYMGYTKKEAIAKFKQLLKTFN